MEIKQDKPISEMSIAERIATWKWRAAKADKDLIRLGDKAGVNSAHLGQVIKAGRCKSDFFDKVEETLKSWGV